MCSASTRLDLQRIDRGEKQAILLLSPLHYYLIGIKLNLSGIKLT